MRGCGKTRAVTITLPLSLEALRMAEDEEETIMLDRQSTKLAEALARAEKHRVAPKRPAPVQFRALELTDFEAVSRKQVELGNRLLSMLPSPGIESAPLDFVCQQLEELTGIEGYRIFLHAMRVHGDNFQMPALGSFFVNRFTLPPGNDVGVIAAELSLFQGVLGAMVGEPEHTSRRIAPVGPRDFGLGTYVLLRLLDGLVANHGMAPFVLGGSAPGTEELAAIFGRSLEVTEVVFLVSAPEHAGFVRLFLPSHMVQDLELFAQSAHANRHRWRSIQKSALIRARVDIELGIARVPLTRLELVDLHVDDLLLPTEHALELEQVQAPDGPARLYIDRAGGKFIPVEPILSQEGGWRVRVLQDHIEIAEDMMSQENTQDHATGASEATSHLIEQAKITVEVRVGNASMSVAEIGAIQSGQVIDLEVPLGQPVALVAGGEQIGKGELVNIEGRLGVRVLARY